MINDNGKGLDVVISMHNLIEYSKNYKKKTKSLWNYYRGEPDNNDIRNFESFKYKTSITGEIHQIVITK